MNSRNISSFIWKKFPVEYNRFVTCICIENENEKILDYFKSRYPINCYTITENINSEKEEIYYTQLEKFKNIIGKGLDQDIKKTIIINLFNLPKLGFHIMIYLEKLLQLDCHIIIIGKTIPNLFLTECDLLFYNNIENLNKYLSTYHDFSIVSFDFMNQYFLIDKKDIGTNLHTLNKQIIPLI